MLDVIIDTIIDALKMLPFLYLAYLLIEYVSHKASNKFQKILAKQNGLGAVAGAVLGCVPQCGFSAAAASLYSNKVITIGTLIAVFLSTSDEAIPVLLTNPGNAGVILKIIIIKVIIAIIAGVIIDFIYKNISKRNGRCINEKNVIKEEEIEACHDHSCHHHHHENEDDHSKCEGNIFVSALKHTLNILLFITIVSFILNTVIHFVGEENLATILMSNSIFQPFLAGLLGFIPNCASSAILTELYISGTLSFGSIIAGLCTSSGIALIVLFKVNHNVKDNIRIMAIMYGIAVTCGVVIHLLGV